MKRCGRRVCGLGAVLGVLESGKDCLMINWIVWTGLDSQRDRWGRREDLRREREPDWHEKRLEGGE